MFSFFWPHVLGYIICVLVDDHFFLSFITFVFSTKIFCVYIFNKINLEKKTILIYTSREVLTK